MVARGLEDVRRRAVRADRQPAHRGQPAQLPPRDRVAVRPRRRVGRLGAPLDRRGGPARHRDPRLPADHARRRPGRARAAADGPHVHRLRVRAQRGPGPLAGLRVLPGARHPGLAPQHRQAHRRPGRRPAARPGRRRREPAHDLLPQPAPGRARARPRTRPCGRSPTWSPRSQMPGTDIAGLPAQGRADGGRRRLRPAPAPRRRGRPGAALLERLRDRGARRRGRAGPHRARRLHGGAREAGAAVRGQARRAEGTDGRPQADARRDRLDENRSTTACATPDHGGHAASSASSARPPWAR